MKKFMGTLLKIILIIAVAIVLGIVAFIILAQYREANYYQYTEAVGRIEKKYTALGEHKVSYQEVDADNDVIGKYAIWYPSKLKSKDNKYPVVIFAKATDKVIARKKNVDHGDSYKQFDGYMTAWFMYYLKDDTEAGNAFFGENAEIRSNALYQDVQANR